MFWKVSFSSDADDELLRLDKPVRERIRKYVKDLEKLANPRLRGEPLSSNLSGFWKYRVGDYRLVCRIQDKELLVLVVKIGHRSEVYKRRIRWR